jgi:hypothetical protein
MGACMVDSGDLCCNYLILLDRRIPLRIGNGVRQVSHKSGGGIRDPTSGKDAKTS